MKKTDELTYIGGATKRVISKTEWQQAGIDGQDDIAWGPLNNRKCKIGDLTTPALELLLMLHPGEFIVGEVTGEKMIDAKSTQRIVDEKLAVTQTTPNGN